VEDCGGAGPGPLRPAGPGPGPHGDGRAQLPGGGGGGVWAVPHCLHGGVSPHHPPSDDAQENLNVQKCDSVSSVGQINIKIMNGQCNVLRPKQTISLLPRLS